MGIDYLYFENYKCFSKSENIQIRPLTILIGRNSSGKSVIARLPILLSHSLGHASTTPLDLHFGGLDYGSSTVDLIYDRVPHGSLTIGAGITSPRGDVQSFTAKIQHFDEYKLQQITHFTYSGRGQDLTLKWRGSDPTVDPTSYLVSSLDDTATVEFRGLFPRLIIKPLSDADGSDERDRRSRDLRRFLQAARYDFEHSLGSINYLGPFRKGPERTYRFPTGVTWSVGFSGAKVADLLGEDSTRRNGRILRAVNRWMDEKLGGWQLGIVQQGDFFSIVLKKPGAPSVEINIADVGTGISQVLPLIVQRMFEAEVRKPSGIEIVEQPELHLHPAVHGDVAELYVLAAKIPGTRLILETHSENFILRVRQCVARGELNPEDVIIYWVDDAQSGSTIKPIHIDRLGEVDTWPTGVFSEDLLEVREIRRAQKSRAK
jgi:predicted ATP-dependent endonuclease of OLD family